MKSYFSRFLHHTLSHSDVKHQSTSMLSYSGLTRISRLNKFATWFDLDHRVKPDGDRKGKDASLKPDGDSLCAGRSMVEMLGVLAIIGVLSVGAIAGYGKAMFKYKLNKQTEQLNQVIGAIVRYKSSLLLNPNPADDTNLSDFHLVPILKKLGEIPKEMYTSSDVYIKDAFGTQYYVYNRNIFKDMVFLRTRGMDRNESSFQICKNLYVIAKEWHQELHSIRIIAYKGDDFDSQGAYCGDNTLNSHCFKRIKDLRLTDLDDICRTAAEEQGAYSVILYF